MGDRGINKNKLCEMGIVNIIGKQETLCWSCKNATGFCSWSNGSFTPVEGWDAIYRPLSQGVSHGDRTNYLVIDCPQYDQLKGCAKE